MRSPGGGARIRTKFYGASFQILFCKGFLKEMHISVQCFVGRKNIRGIP